VRRSLCPNHSVALFFLRVFSLLAVAAGGLMIFADKPLIMWIFLRPPEGEASTLLLSVLKEMGGMVLMLGVLMWLASRNPVRKVAPGEGDADYVCRYFAPCAGIDEDPATGSIQCTLVPYWAERLGKQTLRGRQLSARGAAFECTLSGNRVRIKSQARLYLRGEIEL
jgi:hypothetical protein